MGSERQGMKLELLLAATECETEPLLVEDLQLRLGERRPVHVPTQLLSAPPVAAGHPNPGVHLSPRRPSSALVQGRPKAHGPPRSMTHQTPARGCFPSPESRAASATECSDPRLGPRGSEARPTWAEGPSPQGINATLHPGLGQASSSQT